MRLRHAGDMPLDAYGWARIWSGSMFLSDFDPYWWREGGFVPAGLDALDMADPYRCLLAWWATKYLPDPPRRDGSRQVPPYDRAARALGLSPPEAEALGFTGVDAAMLTAGWRRLITSMRTFHQTPRAELSDPSMAAGLRLAVRLRAQP